MFELDELTGNESPEELEALLDQIEADELEVSSGDTSGDQVTTDDSIVDNTEVSATSEDEPVKSEENELEGVLAKDGKNIIPFDVLEREREANKQLQQQLDEFKSRESQWNNDQRLLELRNKQLEKMGVDPLDLPENIKVTDEQLDALTDDYPELGNVIRSLVAKVEQFESKPAQEPTQSSNPVADAIAENSDLSAWLNEGGDIWNKAIKVDEQLQSDPTWQNKPLSERFSEVVKRVKAEQEAAAQKQPEDGAKKKAKQEEDKLSDLPASPSEVGQTTTHQLSPKERLATADEADIQSMFSGMTEAQIESLLSELDT
ncbi:hypothetical protein SBX64_16040 [Vibrio rhizosphaerae]|uniref:ATPase n=1 Tax=Vibrio rhizosphaerae TaxID=398736 RepID=A0ABU4IXC3_9VIBR|nr:hypothetical protein [Vibrio rhizosphaerae]MDW6094050.1 hypothetical protein [Vibrio rhizosphaerae]